MPVADSFPLFRFLPLELRLQIWSEALSVRSVWAAGRKPSSDGSSRVGRPLFSMAYVGPAPYLAGLSCKEARRVLERSYVEPIRRPSAGVYWIDMEKTVVHLGKSIDAKEAMDNFHAEDLAKFKHVALRWSRFNKLTRACQHLAKSCPDLRTIIIHQTALQNQPVEDGAHSQALSLEMAIYYAAVPIHTGPEMGYEMLDTGYLRLRLLEHFGAPPPRLHFLPPDLASPSISSNFPCT